LSSLTVVVAVAEQVKHFHDAIRHHFWYELFMDDLPIWGFIGEFVFGANQVPALRNHTGHGDHTEMQSYIYTHRRFDISYNGDQVGCMLACLLASLRWIHQSDPVASDTLR
jgi:hypothetical protein